MKLISTILLILLLASCAIGATIHVATDGDDARDKATAASASTPVQTITRAIALATASADTISVAAGTYSNEKVDDTAANGYLLIGKAGLTFHATGAVIVTVSNAAAGRVVRITNGNNGNKFTVGTGGSWTFDGLRGAGDYCTYAVEINATVTGTEFSGCTFKRATIMLGFADMASTGNTLTDCTFTDAGEAITNCNAIVSYQPCQLTLTRCAFNLSGTSTARALRLLTSSTAASTTTFTDCTFGTSATAIKCTANVVSNEGSANVVIDGCTANLGTGVDSFYARTLAGSTGSDTITDNTITCTVAPQAHLVWVSNGTHTVNVSRNTITAPATLAYDLIRLIDQPAPTVCDNTLSEAGTTATIAMIRVSSTGADASLAVIRGNAIYRRGVNGYTILVGDDSYGTGGHVGKCDGAIIEYNRVYGPVYYGTTASSSVLTHGILFAWSKQAHIRYNYVNGCAYGLALKSGGGGGSDLQDYSHIGGVYYNVVVNGFLAGMYAKAVKNTVWEHNTVYCSAVGAVATQPLIRVDSNLDVSDGGGDCDGTIVRHNIAYAAAGTVAVGIYANQGTTTCTGNCVYLPGAAADTDWFSVDGTASTWTEFSAAYAGNVNADPLFNSLTAGDFRLRAYSPCINPTNQQYLVRRTERLYIPQYSWGALPAVYEPLKPN